MAGRCNQVSPQRRFPASSEKVLEMGMSRGWKDCYSSLAVLVGRLTLDKSH